MLVEISKLAKNLVLKNTELKRPGYGLPPNDWNKIIGKNQGKFI